MRHRQRSNPVLLLDRSAQIEYFAQSKSHRCEALLRAVGGLDNGVCLTAMGVTICVQLLCFHCNVFWLKML